MIHKKVVIIGAGASGLMIGNFLKQDFLILEKNSQAGKKILISGAGQCNYTNTFNSIDFYKKFKSNNKFIRYGLSKFNNMDSVRFFDRKGLESFFRKDGKVFPKSKKASDIVNILKKNIEDKIKYNSKVISVEKKSNQFFVETDKEKYLSDFLVIATGGQTYPKTGSEGEGYKFARNLNVPVTEVSNGLCPVYVKKSAEELSGITLKNISANIIRKNKKEENIKGDLLFTHSGLSGPLIINNSRNIKKSDILSFNFLGYKLGELDNKLIKIFQKYPKRKLINALKILELPDRVLEYLVKDIKFDKNVSQIPKELRRKISNMIVSYKFEVTKVGTENNSMVTVGGVDLQALDRKTMCSKKDNKLFFIGEVVDVDGETGGYNIQWAFSSAYIAAEAINNRK